VGAEVQMLYFTYHHSVLYVATSVQAYKASHLQAQKKIPSIVCFL